MNVDDIVGLRFGKLIVVSYSHKVKNKNKNGYSHYYNCKCDCGNNHVAERSSIKFGNTKSCGCIKTEKLIKRNSETAKYNGESRSKYARILRIYRSMCYRCYNKIDESYINYGGRGIKVCDEWLNDYFSFRNWAIDNGYSDNLSIDRIDVNGNYEPSNCRWATRTTQVENTRQLWKHNKSGYRNIYWHKAAKKWDVNFCINGKTTHIGMFINIEDAILHRNNFIIENNMATPLIKF